MGEVSRAQMGELLQMSMDQLFAGADRRRGFPFQGLLVLVICRCTVPGGGSALRWAK